MALPEVPDWTQLIQLMGQYEGTPTLVAVDEDGNIVAIMKGEYAGTLKSIAVDAAGRVIMIPTDPADVWGNAISMGNAELAAVFSFVKRYDRRGMVVFPEGFEGGLSSWVPIESGTGAAVRHSAKQSFSPPYSCELVAGSTGDRYAGLERYLPFPVVGKIGLQASFTLDPETEHVRLILSWYDGTTRRTWAVNYDLPDTSLGCGAGDGQHTILKSDLSLRVSDTQFHTFKFVADLENEAYVRVLCNSLSYTPTGAVISKAADATGPCLVIYIRNYSISSPATNPNIWVDNIILTQMEPD